MGCDGGAAAAAAAAVGVAVGTAAAAAGRADTRRQRRHRRGFRGGWRSWADRRHHRHLSVHQVPIKKKPSTMPFFVYCEIGFPRVGSGFDWAHRQTRSRTPGNSRRNRRQTEIGACDGWLTRRSSGYDDGDHQNSTRAINGSVGTRMQSLGITI